MSFTEIPFDFPFWKIIPIMSTTDDSSTRSEIITNECANEKLQSYWKLMFFFGTAEYTCNFSFVLHFIRFHWSNNMHVEIQPITSKVNEYFNLRFSLSCTKLIEVHELQ